MTYHKDKPLGEYIQSKLGIQLKEYSELCSIPISTLQNRWKNERGKKEIDNAVFRFYIQRFEEL